jgi:D-3-phosphoglycerate dehydrogenase
MLPVIDRFRSVFEKNNIELILPDVEERMEEIDLLPIIGDIDGVICGDDRFTARVIENAPKLKVLSKWGTGIDSLDKAACAKHGVTICNTPNAFSVPVSDTVMAYILNFARNVANMTDHMRAGHWEKIPGRALHECTLGVVGIGNVGKAVVHRADAFGMRILGTDPVTPPTNFLEKYDVVLVSQQQLLEESDFVSINCDLNPTSYHLMSTQAFNLMKPTSVLINTARGPIVDEKALVTALINNQIGGAALDVFEDEPLPLDSPLRTMHNVMLAPHNSNSSPEAWERVHHNTIKNLINVLEANQ